MGGTPGGFSVDDLGTGRYQVPLRVVPGRGGFQPELALSYRSDGGSGQAGVGFGLSGLSQISRCVRTPQEDGIADGVGLRATDRFCLDGSKLVLVSGTYGADGAEYRTKPDRHVRILSHRSATATGVTGPTHFTVWTADGHVQQYGAGDTGALVSLFPATKAYVAWPITRAEDRYGNAITYEYARRLAASTSELERWPTKIRYGHGSTLDRVVTLDWETRPDKRFGYAYGAQRESTQRLRQVTMALDAGGLKRARSYRLDYGTSPTTGQSRLAAVTECGSVPTECLRPTTVDWWDGDRGFLAGATQTGTNGQSVVPPAASIRVVAADYNGDGRTDLAWPEGLPGPEAKVWKYLHAEPDGTYRQVRTGAFNGEGRAATAYPFDYDLDGRADLMPRLANANLPYGPIVSRPNFVYKKVTTEFRGGFNQITNGLQLAGAMLGDLDGDGYQDVLEYRRTLGGTDIRWSWRKRTGVVSPSIDDAAPSDDQAFGPQQDIATLADLEPDDVQLVDVNGDGRDEILYHRDATVRGLDVLGQLPTFEYGDFLHPMVELDLKLADVNGDGLTDVVTNGATTRADELYYRLNDGRRLLPPVRANVGLPAAALALSQVVDYDGDGRHELLVPRQGSTGGKYVGLDVVTARFDAEIPTFTRTATEVNFNPATLEALSAQGTRLVDADGDGQQDVLLVDRFNPTDPGILKVFRHRGGAAGAKPDLLRRVREGTSNPVEGATATPTVEVDYGPLSNGQVHERGNCPRMPHVACTTGGMQVVRRVSTDAGLAGNGQLMVSDYFYRTGRVSKKARAFLGFAERLVTTRSTSGAHQPVLTRTFYSNETAGKDPRPRLNWVVTTLPGGQRSVEQTETSWSEKPTVGGSAFPFVNFSEQRSFQLTLACPGCLATMLPVEFNALNPEPHRIVHDDTTDVDGFGNVVGRRVRAFGADGEQESDTTVTTTMDTDAAAWLVRRPKRVVTTDGAVQGGTLLQRTRTTEFGYVPGTGLVAEEKRFQTDADRGQQLTTTYQYDAEGNRVRTTATDVRTGEVRESTAVYDPAGYPHATMNALGHVSRTGRDPLTGAVRVAVDANGLRVDNTYDSLGRPVRTRQPSGAVSTMSYALEERGAENLVRIETADGTGAVGQTVLDRAGRPVTRRTKGLDGVLRVADLGYEAEGGLISESAPRRVGTAVTDRVTYTYDDTGRPLTRTEPGDAVHRWAYSGATVTETDARGHRTTASVDSAGRPAAVVDGVGTPQEARRTWSYGPFGVLLRTAVDGVPASASTFSYDERNNVLSGTDPGHGTVQNTWDAFGGQLTSLDALGRQRTSVHDALGRPQEVTVRRNGRVQSTQRYYWDVDATRTKGSKGRLMETVRTDDVTQARTAVAYEYDSLGRVSRSLHSLPSERDPAVAETLAVSSEYDMFGRTTAVRYPALPGSSAGTKVGYDYSPVNGRLVAAKVLEPAAEAGALWTAKATDAQDRLTQEESGDRVGTEREYDWRGALLGQAVRTSTGDAGGVRTLLTQDHTYDAVGNLSTSTRNAGTATWATESFDHDPLDRVVRATVSRTDPCPEGICRQPRPGAGGSTAALIPPPPPPGPIITEVTDTWAYDRIGNLTASKRRGTYTYDAARPYQARTVTGGIFGNRSYGYDAVGNQTARPGATVAYTDLDLPATITPAGGAPVTSFAYWPDGQRARQSTPAGAVTTVPGVYERHRAGDRVEHRLLVQAEGRLVASLNYAAEADGALLRRPPRFVHVDRLGSTALVTEDADAGSGVRATVREERSYDTYGLPRNPDLGAGDAGYSTGLAPAAVTQGYTGHEEDRDLGLVDMGGRVYDPTLARFLTPDPLVSGSNASQAWNRYGYVSGNPLRHTDPSGFEECFGCPEQNIWGQGGADAGHAGLEQFFQDSDAFFEGGQWGINPVNAGSPAAHELDRSADRYDRGIAERNKYLDKKEAYAAVAKQKAAAQAQQTKYLAEQAEAQKKLKLWLDQVSDPDKLTGQDAIAGEMLAANDTCPPGECDPDVAGDYGSAPLVPEVGDFGFQEDRPGAAPLPVVKADTTMGADGRIWSTERAAADADTATMIFADADSIRKNPLSGIYATVGSIAGWSVEQIHFAVQVGATLWTGLDGIGTRAGTRQRSWQPEPVYSGQSHP